MYFYCRNKKIESSVLYSVVRDESVVVWQFNKGLRTPQVAEWYKRSVLSCTVWYSAVLRCWAVGHLSSYALGGDCTV